MGKLFDYFNKLTFSNEAEVSQNFILPLLELFLEYSIIEIIPEKHFPAKHIYSGVNFAGGGSKGLLNRPDYVVCINGDPNQVKFIIDSKGPEEDLLNHIGQLKSYATSVGQNFLMITNGFELMIYDVNTLIFHSKGIEDLQLKIDELKILVGRSNQLIKSSVEILKEFNFDKAVSQDPGERNNSDILKRKVQLSDFRIYLTGIEKNFEMWHLPPISLKAISNIDIKKIDPNYLLSFTIHSAQGKSERDEKVLKLTQIESTYNLTKKVFVGETGTGKTSLLKFLTLQTATNASNLIDVKIPIYIALKEIGIGYTLENLITAALRRYGYKCTNYEELDNFTQFVFYLDAFDEVGESFKNEVTNAIENLSHKHNCYITTRPHAVPKLECAIVFDILPLMDSQVEQITKQYIGSSYYHFQQQIENNNLVNESRNTLLLLFMISLYHELSYLPDTASKVINALVDRVRLWQDYRNNTIDRLKWEHVSEGLIKLSYNIFENDETSMKIVDAEPLIADLIIELEQVRKIPIGITVDEFIQALAKTGFIIIGEDHLYFWHRLFLNHFSAIALQRHLDKTPRLIEQISLDQRWDIVIIAMASNLKDVSEVVKQLNKRLWLAAHCLVENPNCDLDLIKKVVDRLIENIESPVPDIRAMAISFLQRINNKQAQEFLLNSFQRQQIRDVKMMCLPAIAINATPKAKEIIDRYLDWNEWSFFEWISSQAYIVQALSYYGDQGLHQIITNWEKYSNYPMDNACRKIFLRLHSTNQLSYSLIERLQNLYLKEFISTTNNREKIEALSDILAEIPNLEFSKKVLALSYDDECNFPKLRSQVKILKSSPFLSLVKKIHNKIQNENPSRYVVENLANALRESVAAVPKEIFFDLINNPNINVASIGLQSLARFEFQEVKSIIDKHLYGQQPQLQSWALKILVENGKIINLIRQDQFPDSFFSPAAHTLLEAVRRFHLVEAMHILYMIQDSLTCDNRHEQETTLAFELAGTFNYMGEIERQRQIIGLYFDGSVFIYDNKSYFQTNLMKKLKYLDRDLAMEIAQAFFTIYLPSEKKLSYETEVFIESAEDLGGDWMREKLKLIVDKYIEQIILGDNNARYAIERPLRALIKIGDAEDEDWLLNKVPHLNFDGGFEYTQLRRAIECLAYIGSNKSLPTILEVAEKLQFYDSVINICQFAYTTICNREKILIEDDDNILMSKFHPL